MAFNKTKTKPMPDQTKVIFDNQTGLYCDHYSININFCSWSDGSSAQLFSSQTTVDAAINSWEGGSQDGRFIGKNPPPH